ncbi:MAG: type VI secretion system baseplate subunit TssF [Alphaproteobacteria bacterium]|nr:type VI secretion system baseplate subunit TssF [Alphaproteobacteria bacterium]
MDFLEYYRENLSYLRTLGAEFANEFPKIANRLNINQFDCADPYVERLLEGTAFLSARVEKKLDDGHKRFLESILSTTSPDVLCPVVSGAVFELEPNSIQEKKDFIVKSETKINVKIPKISTPCTFSTIWDTNLIAATVSNAEYITRDLADYNLDEQCEAALHFTLSPIKDKGKGRLIYDKLHLYFNSSDVVASTLLRQCQTDFVGVYISNDGKNFVNLNDVKIKVPAADLDSTIFSIYKGNAKGLRVLQNYMLYPSFFKFISLECDTFSWAIENNTLDVLITFNRRENELINEIRSDSVKVNCVPTLNLFKKRSDRIVLDKDSYELHVFPEKMRARDFEIIYIYKMEFYNELNEELFDASSFYDEHLKEKDKRNFYSIHRRRSLFDKKATLRSSYSGTEVFASVSGNAVDMQPINQYLADMVCSNRDLPLLVTNTSEIEINEKNINSAKFVSMPTRPNYPLIDSGKENDWVKVSHVMMNISSIMWENGTLPLSIFKDIIKNYNSRSVDELARLLEGIVDLHGEPTTFRFIKNGNVFFETGWKISFTLNENSYAGLGFYTFGVIIAEMLKSFSSLNALVEIEFLTQQSGLIKTWRTSENI